MKINLILQPRKNLQFDFDNYENSLYIHYPKKECINVITKDLPFPDLTTRCVYPFYVKSHIDNNGIKHITTPGNAHILHFIDAKKSIVTCHDVGPLFLNYFNAISVYLFKYSMTGMMKADRIIADSESTKKDILEYLNYPEDKIIVVYLGVDHSRYKVYKNANEIKDKIINKYGINNNKNIVLYVGAEQPRKNLDTLIKAFYKLKKKTPETKLIKVGHPYWGGARKKLLNLITSLNLQKDVLFIDYVGEKELPLFYNAADLFVFPSYFEGFGQPPLEAMACGCPVITTNKSSIPEIVGDAAIKLDDPFDVDLLVRTMEEVLTDDDLKQSMINKGLVQARKFSWKKYAEEVYDVYEAVWNEE